ncbi:alpha/beta fold hydrolase [filamentous cyanobacterium LEGE 11480]|uniref:Alpha/beta fold hydrolase n=1 Tax=Romeriopsis navalis LEGE 11480 TaxID=2777977 RepID=A0A928VKQ9_9CYAN|nr:alpha/beta hydrolase [Romeriopsis navalis]MBE9029442.1 alpha/beta fold hydrolase [Romeriopsis navalis LEGE 11480]
MMLTPAFVAQVAQQESMLPLRNDRCRSRFWLHDAPTSQVFVLFHGITAAPYQFDTLGERLYAAGYNVLAPLMPGHGQAGDWDASNPPPLPEDMRIYQDFVDTWLVRAQPLGEALIVGGLSAGGALATWAAVKRADRVSRALLFAPYLSNASLFVDLIASRAQGYFAWPNGRDRIGYPGFRFPALDVFPPMGRELLRLAAIQKTAPMCIISTDTDVAVDNDDHVALFESIRGRQPISWYHRFPVAMDIPHAMMAPEEGNQWTAILNTMVLAYVESQLSWAEVEEIAYRMTDGKTFPQVVSALGVQDKCSPYMPAMMTMVDKRKIVLDRQKRHQRGSGFS